VPPGENATILRPAFDLSIPEATFRLVVVQGTDAGKSLTLDGSQPARVLIGQGPACDFRLSDPSVSRRHLAVDVSGALLRITDLGSTNRTLVQGVMVQDAYLRGGEELRLGDTMLQVEREERAAPSLPTTTSFGRILGLSTEMRRLYPLCERLAAATVPAVIEGDTGTGKELLARSLHEKGPRAQGPFVLFDCTAFAANLIEAELFGVDGAKGRKGALEQAHGGTLFVDEIDDLDLGLQQKLLRVLETGRLRRTGGTDAVAVEVRVIAATRRDLDREVAEGRFSDDLFNRLSGARIELPPLRARRGDVPMLARQFWSELGGNPSLISANVLQRWETYGWPGNVRELKNAVARQLSLGDLAPVENLAPLRQTEGPAGKVESWYKLRFDDARKAAIDAFEKRYLDFTLARFDGNLAKAAEASGLGKRFFQMVKALKS
jgi:DNA-binding NtrC family response regulator